MYVHSDSNCIEHSSAERARVQDANVCKNEWQMNFSVSKSCVLMHCHQETETGWSYKYTLKHQPALPRQHKVQVPTLNWH